ncbi:MAG TPA: flagellar basal body protein FliL [Aliiroseovarius sp.]|nr:flagellar basal body protein FliL [Aliiroseovarius sp.]
MAKREENTAGEAEASGEAPAKKSKKPLLIGLVLALALGGGGFYATYTGLILAPAAPAPAEGEGPASAEIPEMPPVAFVPLEPLIISLGPGADNRHLRFRAELEVEPKYQQDVEMLIPRVLDVLNTYLRAVDMRDIEEPSALLKLRAQMLRRIQLVIGEGKVSDLLITEFVLN